MTLIAKSNVLSGFLAIAWSCAPSAWAWGGQGHRTIGAIADRLLSPAARAAVAQLLSGDLDKFGRLSTRRTLEAVSDWADEITATAAARPRWHYDDAPICGSAPKAHYCPDGQCNTEQLKRLITVLADTHAASRDRNEALKWVVHLVGDIHQPLHAADNGDRGGNHVPVSFFGERDNPPYGSLNLHAIWDVHMVRRLVVDRGGERAIVSAPIADSDRNAWEKGPISGWIDESHRIARDTVYPLLPVAASCSNKIVDVVAIGEEYYSKAAPVIEIQIRKAGVRLARVLNETLGR